MKIAVLDADLIARKRHRFPNLVCMKLSGYHKSVADEVTLKTDYADLDKFDKVYIAKVFTNTKVPSEVLHRKNVLYGGTGFFYDKAVPLPYIIEHHMPDYGGAISRPSSRSKACVNLFKQMVWEARQKGISTIS